MLSAVRFVLASASPRRQQLLKAAGFTFDVDALDIDETARPRETPAAYVERLAREKALAGSARHGGRVVLGADTTVAVDDEMLGKPVHEADATRMIGLLSGRAHDVFTGIAVARDGEVRSGVARTAVWMREWPDQDVARYVRTAEPFDKAGAYAIQGAAGGYITRIEGDRDTVIGLSVALATRLLAEMGVLRDADAAPYSEG